MRMIGDNLNKVGLWVMVSQLTDNIKLAFKIISHQSKYLDSILLNQVGMVSMKNRSQKTDQFDILHVDIIWYASRRIP